MITLVTAAQVRGRLNLPDDEGVNAAISAVLKSLPAIFEAQLQTSLTKIAVADTFAPLSRIYPVVGGFFTLKLSNGFVRPSPAMVVTYSDSYAGAPSGTTIPTTEYLLRAEKGHLLVPEYCDGMFVRVAYETGFLNLEKPPEWLSEAALIYAIEMMSSQKVGDPQPELSSIFKFWGTHRVNILDAHLRSKATAVPPL